MLKVVPPKTPVVTLGPLTSYTRAEIVDAIHVAKHVGPFYLAPPNRRER
jgi:hypothetical protein